MGTAVDISAIAPLGWVLLVAGCLVIGFSKTAFAGVGLLATVAFAFALPTRASTGAVLPMLILADVVAVALYRRHAHWKLLVRLLPWMLVGLALGAVFLDVVDDVALRRFLGVLLLLLAGLQGRAMLNASRAARAAARERPGQVLEPSPGPESWSPLRRRALAGAAGGSAGFATMVANAAGPISTMYLLVMRVDKMGFVGTAAWLFFIVNLAKVPFSVGLGLIDGQSLLLNLLLAPAVLAGAFLGAKVLRRVPQRIFASTTLALTAVSAVGLLLV